MSDDQTCLTIDGSEVDFAKSPLIPAIIRDHHSGAVLMLAYMNSEALERALTTGETWFWSRSRAELWNKGATSGNRQRIVRLSSDCDGDALLIDVEPSGPACHTGAMSCFGISEALAESSRAAGTELALLLTLLRERKRTLPDGSYSTKMFRLGTNAILKKVGEESTEVILAATSESRSRLVEELADLTFHLLLLLVDRDIDPSEIGAELMRRSGGSQSAD